MRRRTYLRTLAAGGTVVAGIGANASDTVVQTAAAQTASDWSQQATLTPDDGDDSDLFGFSVSMSGDGTTAIIGGVEDENPNGSNAGSAYVFTESDGEWKLSADDGDNDDFFGQSVSISGDGTTAIIGAVEDEDPNGNRAGSAYVFTESGGEWSQQQKLSADDGDNDDLFGWSVSMSGDGTTAIIGAIADEDPNGEDAGSAYVFTSGDGSDGDSSLTAYTNENGVVDSQGLLDAAADFRDGEIDAGTLLDVAAAFRSGEPVT